MPEQTLSQLAEGMSDDDLLFRCEKTIKDNLSSALRCAEAFVLIKDRRLFRLAGYRGFEAYCTERWGLSRWVSYRAVLIERGYQVLGNRSYPTYVAETIGKSSPTRRERILRLLREDPNPTRAKIRALPFGDGSDDEDVVDPPEQEAARQSDAKRVISAGDAVFGPMLRAIGDLIQSIRAAMASECGQGLSQSIERAAVQLRDDVALARPCYCPSCSGYGCRYCNDTGWLYRYQALQVERDRKTARSRGGS